MWPGSAMLQTQSLHLALLNEPPLVVDDEFLVTTGLASTLDVLANDSDPDGDPLDVFIVIPPVHGTASAISLDEVIYTSDPDFTGIDSMAYRACDSGIPVLCADAWIRIEVIPANLPPEARVDTVRTLQNLPIRFGVLENDTDPEGEGFSSVSIVDDPMNGRATTGFLGQINYVPDQNFTGLDSLRYEACDGASIPLCDLARVYIQVEALELPDSFSPNGDGLNDTYDILGAAENPANSLEIIDRRGELVYSRIAYDNSWDGRDLQSQKELPEDVYFYRFRLDEFGVTLTGSIVLKR